MLYLKGTTIMMFQLSGFYNTSLCTRSLEALRATRLQSPYYTKHESFINSMVRFKIGV